jgi:predicted O-methyltransferase YrrM
LDVPVASDEAGEIVPLPGRDDAWRVGDTEFVRSFGLDSTPDRFCIRKDASLIRLYASVCSEIRGGRIVELGIADGGGTALLALVAQPTTLVACELAAEPRPALDAFIRHHQLADVVRPFYGVDQADRHELARLVGSEFDGPIDLVVDDASHLYEPTLASFEVLFPRLRPGGLFVIEDWAADFAYAAAIATALGRVDDPSSRDLERHLGGIKYRQDAGESKTHPLPRLALQLLLMTVASPGIVSSVTLDRQWLTVRRGPEELDPTSFTVVDGYADPFRWLEEPER